MTLDSLQGNRFFSLSHNSFATRGFPWIDKIVAGLITGQTCKECGTTPLIPQGPLLVTLEPGKGRKWPDVLGCGSYPLLIVSNNVIDSWQKENIGEVPHNQVNIAGTIPEKIRNSPPTYYWIDGSLMLGSLLDFEASGFVGVQFCSLCRNRVEDIGATYERQRSRRWPFVFKHKSWAGANIFTSDLSPTQFFCTDAVLKCAQSYSLTNFRFIPVEYGYAPEHKGIKYF